MKTVTKITHKKIGRHRAVGLAYKDTGEIVIDSRIKGYNHLIVAIHEVMHIQNKSWTEEEIEEYSAEIATILWELNYRRTEL